MAKSKIEWTQNTWNPVTGCNKISEGCKHCYAETMSRRLKAMGVEKYKNNFKVTLHDNALEAPLKWKKPRTVFVNSMSDLFHKDVPLDFIQKVFEVMGEASQHKFQVLTKRAERLEELSPYLNWHPNIWMGVSVENQENTYRIEHLRNTGAKIKFLSIEPLIGKIFSLQLDGIDWVIVGGESGFGARTMKEDWVLTIRDLCLEKEVPFFFKQWGGVNKKKNGRTLENKTYDEMPV